MVAEKNPQIKKAVVRLAELSEDERTQMLLVSQQMKEWDIRARERGAVITVVKNLLKRGRPIEEIMEDTGLTYEDIIDLSDNLLLADF
jgi:hypothetical protein